MVFLAFKTFDLVPKTVQIIKTFDLVPKKTFDLLPNLRETFNLLKRSSEIQSSDQLPSADDFKLKKQGIENHAKQKT
jgi:hypothetical protein